MASALHTHPGILGQSGRIVIFQNGWGNDVPFLAYFPSCRVFNARIITGFQRVAPGVTNVTVHTAPILPGSLHADAADENVPTPTHRMIVELIRGIEDIRCKGIQ